MMVSASYSSQQRRDNFGVMNSMAAAEGEDLIRKTPQTQHQQLNPQSPQPPNNNNELSLLEKKNYRANQYRIYSITYGAFFCLSGIVLTTIEPFKACTECENYLKIFIESFFIFMYLGSVIWIIIMFFLITMAKTQQKIAIKSHNGMNRRLSATTETAFPTFKIKKRDIFKRIFRKKNQEGDDTTSSSSETEGENAATKPTAGANFQIGGDGVATMAPSTANSILNLHSPSEMSKFYFTYDYENGTGELYMRVGTAIFAMCSMIDRCLSLIQMIETFINNHSAIDECRVTFIISMVSKILSILFIFTQSFFIFKYANIVINYGKNSAVLGLMHIVCTNFCVFFRTVVYETVTEIRDHHQKHIHDKYDPNAHLAQDKVSPFLSYLAEDTSNQTISAAARHEASEFIVRLNSTIRTKQLGCINTLAFTSDIAVGIQEAFEKLSPYLYPCIIEYSLMCMTIFYILWSSIEQRYSVNNSSHWLGISSNNDGVEISTPGIGNSTIITHKRSAHPSPHLGSSHQAGLHYHHHFEKNPNLKLAISNSMHHTASASLFPNRKNSLHKMIGSRTLHVHSHHHVKRNVNQFVIDCGKSTTGLFFGIFVLLMTLISLITYFIYRHSNSLIAVQVSEATELVLITLSFLISIMIFLKLKSVKFSQKLTFEMDYNETLIIVGLGGIYLYNFYSIVAILNTGIKTKLDGLIFGMQIVSIVESTFQSFLIIQALKMFARSKAIKKYKPGRSLITLLILIDVSLWLSETFSVKKYDMNTTQLDFYGIVFWSIVSSISSPLAIFFRFHASVCLSDIWKTLYEYD